MADAVPTKDTRINLRIDPEQKELIERASSARGLNLSAYITSVVVKAAQEDLLAQQRLVLSDRDRDLFLSALSGETQPNLALQSAAAEFREKYGSSVDL